MRRLIEKIRSSALLRRLFPKWYSSAEWRKGLWAIVVTLPVAAGILALVPYPQLAAVGSLSVPYWIVLACMTGLAFAFAPPIFLRMPMKARWWTCWAVLAVIVGLCVTGSIARSAYLQTPQGQ